MAIRCGDCGCIAREDNVHWSGHSKLKAFRCGCRIAVVDTTTEKVIGTKDMPPESYVVFTEMEYSILSPPYGVDLD